MNCMKPLSYLIIILFLSVTVKAQLKKFSIEVPIVPKVSMPDSIQSLTLMNRSLTPDHFNYIDDSLQVEFYRANFNHSKILLDTQVADTTLKALGELLFDTERFDVVIPVERNLDRYSMFNKTPDPLTWDQVSTICSLYETDAVLVLENLAVNVVSNYKRKNEYVYDGIYRTYYASLDVYTRAHWRIYYPKAQAILVDIVDSDTVFWDSYELSLSDMFNNLPTVRNACIQAGIKAADNFTKLIAPSWREESRYYYVMKEQAIDASVKFASDSNWEAALNNWLRFVDSGSKSKRSKVMMNVALAYEMLGDLNQAIEWVNKSQLVYYREVSNHYLKQLINRKAKQKQS
jgi:hypothetical protein